MSTKRSGKGPKPATPSRLDRFRAGAPTKASNARSLAALADNPGCNTRRVFDAAGIDTAKLASKLGDKPSDKQSLFAPTRGNRFEADVKAHGYAALIQLLREAGFSVPAVRVLPLREIYAIDPKAPHLALALRAAETKAAVQAMARGAADAYNLIDGGAMQWDYGGLVARLETDGIAWQIGGRIHVIEIKSFPIVDGQADPDKVGAAARQAAVYVAALEDLLAEAGLDEELVSKKILLVCPRNTSLVPTLRDVDVSRQVRSLRRMLEGRDSIEQLLGALEPGASLSTEGMDEQEAAEHIAGVLESLGTNYLPSCLSACPFALHCRDRARAAGEPGCLGAEARSSLGPVRSLPRLVELSKGAPASNEEREAASSMVRARQLLKAAGVPATPVVVSRRGAA
jgi:hypothetical protein